MSSRFSRAGRETEVNQQAVDYASDEDDTEDDDPSLDPHTANQPQQVFDAASCRDIRTAHEAILARIFGLEDVATEGKQLETEFTVQEEKQILPTIPESLIRQMGDLVISGKAEIELNNPDIVRFYFALKQLIEPDKNTTIDANPQDQNTRVTMSADPLCPHTQNHSAAQPTLSHTNDPSTVSMPPPESSTVSETQTKSGYADELGIDIDHPDENTIDSDTDEEKDGDNGELNCDNIEAGSDSDCGGSPSKSTRNGNLPPRISTIEGKRNNSATASQSAQSKEYTTATVHKQEEDSAQAPKFREQLMQDYISATHGLQLEEFRLSLIPLKASLVARALDLSVLRRITLLEVGAQSPFWSLLQRLSKTDSEIGFDFIHTDDVSTAFLKYLSATTHSPRTVLLMKRKTNKREPHSSEEVVNTQSIFSIGLRKHSKTLTELMLRNNNDDTWDIDEKYVRLLSLRCPALVELAINVQYEAVVRSRTPY